MGETGGVPVERWGMHTSKGRFRALLLLAASAPAVACSNFGSDTTAPDTVDPATTSGVDGGSADSGPKAPIVNGTPDTSDINETLGVFVAPKGKADGAGTRAWPLGSIQAGIDMGKRVGKRVYVCAGTFPESLVIADSISIIGGLDCTTPEWRIGPTKTRIEAPVTPAVVATNISTPTRLEGLDIVAADATEPSGSSTGLLAKEASGLTIVSSRIEAGNGAKGADGTDGIQLV